MTRDFAIDCLEKCTAMGNTHGQWMQHDSDLDPLRQHPRFLALMERLP